MMKIQFAYPKITKNILLKILDYTTKYSMYLMVLTQTRNNCYKYSGTVDITKDMSDMTMKWQWSNESGSANYHTHTLTSFIMTTIRAG